MQDTGVTRCESAEGHENALWFLNWLGGGYYYLLELDFYKNSFQSISGINAKKENKCVSF